MNTVRMLNKTRIRLMLLLYYSLRIIKLKSNYVNLICILKFFPKKLIMQKARNPITNYLIKSQLITPIEASNVLTSSSSKMITTDFANSSSINNKLVSDLGEISPSQPNIDFPKNDGRKFNSEWYSLFNWLEYSLETDAAFCFACRKFLPPDSLEAEPAFTKNGFSNWKKAMESDRGFRKHEQCTVHQTSYGKLDSA